ncbi:hypothetical protein [Cytobacillus oceanisediminis]
MGVGVIFRIVREMGLFGYLRMERLGVGIFK